MSLAEIFNRSRMTPSPSGFRKSNCATSDYATSDYATSDYAINNRKISSPSRLRRDDVMPATGNGVIPARNGIIKGRMTSAMSRVTSPTPRMTSPSPRVTSPIFDAAPKSFFEDDDLDNFYFQQIVDSIPDESLQHKIDLEMKIHDGTTKLLQACCSTPAPRQPKQLLEAAKSLIVTERRMKAYSDELQKQKAPYDQPLNDGKDQVPCKAKLSMSEVRIPLLWRGEDLKPKHEKSFAIFCLVKIGSQVCETALKCNIDRNTTDIFFDDLLIFDRVPPDFECVIEVYAYNPTAAASSSASTPTRIRRKLSEVTSSVGRSVGKRVIKQQRSRSTGETLERIGPEFHLVATSTIGLDSIEEDVRSHDIVKENVDEGHAVPFFGQICCRVAAQPICMVKPAIEGFLSMRELGRRNGKTCWSEYWCQLCNLKLSCWTNKQKASSGKPPYLEVPVTKSTQVSLECAKSKGRPGFVINASFDENGAIPGSPSSSSSSSTANEFIFSTENFKTQNLWWKALQQHLLDQVSWRSACESSLFSSASRCSLLDEEHSPSKANTFVGTGSALSKANSLVGSSRAGSLDDDSCSLRSKFGSSVSTIISNYSMSTTIYDATVIEEPSSKMQCSTYDNVPSNPTTSSGRSTPMTISSSKTSTRHSGSTASLSPLTKHSNGSTASLSSPTAQTRMKSPSPSRKTSSTSSSNSSSTPSSIPRQRHPSSTDSSSSISSSKQRHPSKSSLSSYPSLDEDAIEDLLLKYTSSTSGSTIHFGSNLTNGFDFNSSSASHKKINALLASWLPKTKNWISSNS